MHVKGTRHEQRPFLKNQGHTAIFLVERRVKTKRIQQICRSQTILHPQKARRKHTLSKERVQRLTTWNWWTKPQRTRPHKMASLTSLVENNDCIENIKNAGKHCIREINEWHGVSWKRACVGHIHVKLDKNLRVPHGSRPGIQNLMQSWPEHVRF